MDFLSLILGEPMSSEGRIARDIATTMHGYKLMDRATDAFLPNSEAEDLDLQDKRLSIALRRRALGLPMDSDDLDAANNSDSPFLTQMTTLGGLRTLQAIPGPNLLQGAESAASHVRLPWEATNMARGALGALSAIGGKYVSPIGRFFG
jgi:hypothetical protein